MGCILCDCNNELKYNNINSIEDKIDLSILNNSSFLTTSLDSTIPMSSLNYSTHIENRFFFDVNMGEGTFGFSMKIIEKPTKKEYSLKILPKDDETARKMIIAFMALGGLYNAVWTIVRCAMGDVDFGEFGMAGYRAFKHCYKAFV